MTEIKAQLLTELPYHRIEQPRHENKYLKFFGSYVALPLILTILIVSLLILFLLVKTYFSNSYMYAMQDNLANKNTINLDIGAIVDTRYDQFNSNRKPSSNIHFKKLNSSSLLEKAFGANSKRI